MSSEVKEAAERAKRLATRSGAKSTEFWAILAGTITSVVMAVFKVGEGHWAVQLCSLVVPIIGPLIYAAFRGKLKKTALETLAELVKRLKEAEKQ